MAMPQTLLELLKTEKLCFLSTSDQDQPHLFLMNFTYLPEKGLIILTSRANTTKVSCISHNPRVALLLAHFSGEERPAASCTVYGKAHIEDPARDSFYRQVHLQRHPGMETFISGEGIVVVTVTIQHAVIATIQDQVTSWSAEPTTY